MLSEPVHRYFRPVDLVTTLLGSRVDRPSGSRPRRCGGPPTANGEVATATSAATAGAPMVPSRNAESTFEEVGATGALWWLQPPAMP